MVRRSARRDRAADGDAQARDLAAEFRFDTLNGPIELAALLDTGTTSPQRMAAFNETFVMLAVICGLAVVAALKLRER